MTTLPLRASHMPTAPRIWCGLARFGAFIVTMLDVFAEAELRAMAAHQRLSRR